MLRTGVDCEGIEDPESGLQGPQAAEGSILRAGRRGGYLHTTVRFCSCRVGRLAKHSEAHLGARLPMRRSFSLTLAVCLAQDIMLPEPPCGRCGFKASADARLFLSIHLLTSSESRDLHCNI
jgi:hypothetical protein